MSYLILQWHIRCHEQTCVGFYKVYKLYVDVGSSEDLLLDYLYNFQRKCLESVMEHLQNCKWLSHGTSRAVPTLFG